MVFLTQLLETSSSPSSSTHAYKYDVFLSFRGLDTRRSFIDHLHKALIEANVVTFLDEEDIETGLHLKPELESGIKASRASIIVLSENYASSTWCLNELALILHQHRTSGHIVIPIFYHVQPTKIRKQQGSFGDAMAKHQQRMEAETNADEKSQLAQKITTWKKALAEVANLKGNEANGRFETEFIDEIVKDIYHRLSLHLRSPPPLLIGRGSDIKFITSWVENRTCHTVDILTIYGMSGIGKTSLAKYVHGRQRHVFDKSSFIEDIGTRCAQFNGLLDLQKQLCVDISKPSPIQVHDVSVYTSKIENALARNKVFLVLDDVNSLEQLNALLGSKDFHPGSKVIITTSDMPSIESCALFNLEVPPRHGKHLLQGLQRSASLQLLSYHAFNGNRPKEGYEQVSEELMVYCGGHPLALKVLGETLHKRDVAVWEEYIEGLKEEPEFRIQRVLRMSFDSLSKNHKELYKHIACFFVGEDRKFTETVLKACGFRTLHGIQSLVDKCLLMIGSRNELKMHRLLQGMGREIVHQESPNKPEERSRLCCHEESFNVLEQNKGKEKLLGLVLDMRMLKKDKLCAPFELKTEVLSKMDNLMLLQLNFVQIINGSCKNFPQKLRWLCMRGFPLKSIPLDSPMENLVALDMSYGNLEIFDMACSNIDYFDMSYSNCHQPEKRRKLIGSRSENRLLLKQLKILNLSFCKQLRSVGGFSALPALERLILANCIGLTEVCESIEQCEELIVIDLSYCCMLKKLPRTIVKLKKVETLLLDCIFQTDTRDIDLQEMPMPVNIDINSYTSPFAIVEATPREFRPAMAPLLSSLLCLSLKDNNLSNDSFPMDLGSLSMLKELYLDGNPIISLPNSVTNLPGIERLSILGCRMLKTFKNPPRTLQCLEYDFHPSEQSVEFDTKESPFTLELFPNQQCWSPFVFELEAKFKMESMAQVAEDILHSLGWEEIQLTKNHRYLMEPQMDYEFGVLSTMYVGEEIPNWISHRNNGSSISFTMPPSSYKLRGFNFCSVCETSDSVCETSDSRIISLIIKTSNITKKHAWRYRWSGSRCYKKLHAKGIICLSHWMFQKNEMEDGDHVNIQIFVNGTEVKECGVKLVYDDGNMEDPCGLSQFTESHDWWGPFRFLDNPSMKPLRTVRRSLGTYKERFLLK